MKKSETLESRPTAKASATNKRAGLLKPEIDSF